MREVPASVFKAAVVASLQKAAGSDAAWWATTLDRAPGRAAIACAYTLGLEAAGNPPGADDVAEHLRSYLDDVARRVAEAVTTAHRNCKCLEGDDGPEA
jgi:hypothetical protein